MDTLNLTYFDYAIFAILLYSVTAAFYEGFIKTSTSFLSWTISFLGAYLLYNPIERILSMLTNVHLMSVSGSLILGYITSLIIISMITNKIIAITPNIRGGVVDRSLGFSFGLIRGAVIACVIFKMIAVVSPWFFSNTENAEDIQLPETVKKAKTLQLLQYGSNFLVSLAPEDLLKQINDLTNKKEHKDISDHKKDKDSSLVDDTEKFLESLTKANQDDTNKLNQNEKEGINYNGIDISNILKKLQKLTK